MRGWRLLVAGGLGWAAAVGLVVASGAGRTDGAPAASPATAPTPAAPAPDERAPEATPRPRAAQVLPAPDRSRAPDPAVVQAVLAGPLADPALGPQVGASVVDLTTGAVLLDRAAGAGAVPASTTKIVTATAVLDLLGPQHRFTTEVTWRPATGELVLVGGGDPLLSRADGAAPATSFPAFVRGAVAQLQRLGVASVAVRVDDARFAGDLPPSWPASYVGGVASPISALGLDGGRVAPGAPQRSPDPALAAGEELAAGLGAAGIAVAGPPARTASAPDDQTLVTATSAPLADAVEQMLLTSDNDAAEVLGRHLAIAAGQPPTAAGVAAALQSAAGGVLVGSGVDPAAVGLADASGLSRDSRLAPAALTALLRQASAQSPLRAAVTGLPVAGLSGTLAGRYEDPAEVPGAGRVRAKTGTLTGVSGLAGLVDAVDGRTYAFAFLADANASTPAAQDALDRAAAALAACTCGA